MSTFLSVSFGSQLLNFLQRCLRNRRFFHDLHAKGDGLTHADLDIRCVEETGIDVSKLHCDLYEFLKGSVDAVNSYAGEYMNNYSWAELTNARLYNGTFSDFVLVAQARPRR